MKFSLEYIHFYRLNASGNGSAVVDEMTMKHATIVAADENVDENDAEHSLSATNEAIEPQPGN